MANETGNRREGANRRSFRLKVEIFEAAVEDGEIPQELRQLTRLKDIAAWVDPARNLTAWTSPNVHSKNGHNPDLVERIHAAQAKIALHHKSKTSGAASRHDRKHHAKIIAHNRVLMIQNEDLLAREEQFQKLLRLASRDLEIANRRLRQAGLATVSATFAKSRL